MLTESSACHPRHRQARITRMHYVLPIVVMQALKREVRRLRFADNLPEGLLTLAPPEEYDRRFAELIGGVLKTESQADDDGEADLKSS